MLKFRQELEEWLREYTEEEWTGKISSLSLSGLALSTANPSRGSPTVSGVAHMLW